MEYLFVFSTSILFMYLYDKEITEGNKLVTKKNMFLLISFLPTFLLSALRLGIGTDYYYTYVPVFESIQKGIQTHVEIGYYFINRFVQLFNGDVQWVFVITSFIFCFNVYCFISQNSKNKVFSLILFFITETYFFSFNVVRQSIATSFFLVAIPFILQKKPLHYFILILIAASFHQLALIYLPVYLFSNIKLDFKKDKIAVAVLSLMAIFQGLLKDMLSYVLSFTRFSWYLDSIYSEEGYPGFVITFTLIVILILFVYISYNEKLLKTDDFYLYKNIHYFCCFILSISPIIPNTYRLLMLFIPVLIVSLTYTIDVFSNSKVRKLLITLILIIFTYLFIKRSIILGYNEVIPYQSIFEIHGDQL